MTVSPMAILAAEAVHDVVDRAGPYLAKAKAPKDEQRAKGEEDREKENRSKIAELAEDWKACGEKKVGPPGPGSAGWWPGRTTHFCRAL